MLNARGRRTFQLIIDSARRQRIFDFDIDSARRRRIFDIDYFGDCGLWPEFVFEPVVGEEGKVFEVNSVVA